MPASTACRTRSGADDRGALPGEPGDDRADDRPAEPARDRPEIAPARVHPGHYSCVSNRADRGALPGAGRDGRDQRHARLVLRRRRALQRRAGGDDGVGDARRGRGDRRRRRRVDAARLERRRAPRRSCARVEPVLADLAGAPVSIDTSKAAVARRALELGVELVNDVTALRGDPGARGCRRRRGLLPLPHAHAGRAADDAGRPGLRRRRLGREAVPRGAARVRGRGRDRRAERLPRPRDRLREDGRAQLRARAPARRAVRARPAGADRLLAQEQPRRSSSAATGSATAAVSVGAAVAAYDRGATILRVHDVREHVEALAAAKAVRG